MIPQLQQLFKKAGQKAYPQLDSEYEFEITPAVQDRFGHYQFNSALKLTKILQENPRQIAQKFIDHLDKNEIVEKLEIAGPGFINIFLNPLFLSNKVEKILKDPHLDIPLNQNPKKVIVEFSSPNVAKELHVGHLRSTIIGESIARLFEFLGDNVLRLNHIGDWGTQFGMLIHHMKEKHPEVFAGDQKTDLPQLMGWYKESKIRFDSDPEFKKRAQLEVVALQAGNPSTKAAWEIICAISRKGYQEIYDLLDVNLTERGESFYNAMLPGVVTDLEKQNLIVISEGAKCMFFEGIDVPLMVQKTDGGYNYDTTDMAAMRHRVDVEKAEHIIIITDLGQSLHFKLVFLGATKAGWVDVNKTKLTHIGFGLVLGPDGKKFKTRSGDTEKLIDLLYKGIEHADILLKERSPEMNEDERKTLAHALGLSAIKYADLSCHRTSDYTFSYEKMLKFVGNTAAFLMYSYVRILGIKRKMGPEAEKMALNSKIQLEHPSEIALGLHLCRFQEALESFKEELLPNRLTDYLYQLADKFNAFFRDCRVEGVKESGPRWLLCEVTAKVLKQGFDILGLTTVDKM